jgi:galactan 5-O-arabinofuranosyltransferase
MFGGRVSPGGPGATLDRRGVLRFVGECVGAVLAAAAISLVVQKLVGLLLIPRPSAVPSALSALVALGTVLIVGGVVVRSGWSRRRTVLGWVIPAACSSAIQTLVFSGSRFYLNGTNDDQLFRMQLFVRMANAVALSDGNYAGLPSFYPVTWFWLGGRFADLSGIEPWAAYKPFCIATMAAAPALAFVVWSRVVGRAPALTLALAVVAVGLTVEAYEPYRWIIVVTVPPAIALAMAEFRRRLVPDAGHGPGGNAVVVGMVMGLALSTYTLMFGLLCLGVALAASVAAAWAEGVGPARPRDLQGRVMALASSLFVIAAVAAVVGLPVWVRYILAALTRPSAGNGAARYFPDGSAVFPLPMLEWSPIGVLSLAGLTWMIFGRSRRGVAISCAVTAGACYVWHILSTVALVARTSLLAVIVDSVLVLTLCCAAVLGGWEIVGPTVVDRVRRRAAIAAALAASALFVSLTQSPSALVADRLDATFAAFDDQGRRADDGPAVPSPGEPGSWNGRILATVASLSGRPPEDIVLLTDDWPLLVFRPFRSFQTIVQEYANPLALFPARRAEIDRWASAHDPQQLARMLASSPFRAPDVFILRKVPAGLAVQVSTNRFPLAQTNDFRDVVLDPNAFTGPGWERVEVGPYAVIARR